MEAERRHDSAVRGRIPLAVVLAILAIAVPIPGAQADPDPITTFPLPSESEETSGLTVGPDGNLWFGENGSHNAIGRITPQGEITEFPLPSSGPVWDIVSGPDSNIWFRAGDNPKVIAKITPDGQISEFPLSGANNLGEGLVAGSDGNVWFPAGPSIGKITPSGQITEYPLSTGTKVNAIVAGSDGDVWFTAAAPSAPPGGKYGRIAPDGEIREFDLPPRTYAQRLFVGPDHRLRLSYGVGQWNKYAFLEAESTGIDLVGANGELTEDPLHPPCIVCQATVGPDGNVWYTRYDKVSRFSATGQLTTFDLPQGVSAGRIVSGPDGNLWFAGSRFARPHITGLIGRISPNLLEASLAGEWWKLWVTGRWTKLSVVCVATEEARVCKGTLKLTTEVGPGQPSGSNKTVVLARRPYRLQVGSQHEFSLHLSRKTFGIRIKHAVLQDVQVTATAAGGLGMSRPTLLKRPHISGKHRYRHPRHRGKR